MIFFLFFWLIVHVLALILAVLWLISLFQTGVPNISSRKRVAKAMVELAHLKKGERVVDLGCGTGRILREAKKKGAKVLGYEKDPLGRLFCALYGIPVKNQDFFTADFSKEKVLFTYLFPFLMKKIEKTVWPKLKNGTKLISHAFPFENIPFSEKKLLPTGEILYMYQK